MDVNIPDKVALSTTAVASSVAGWNWLSAANDFLTLGVTLVALLGAIAATAFHYEGWRQRRRTRKEKE